MQKDLVRLRLLALSRLPTYEATGGLSDGKTVSRTLERNAESRLDPQYNLTFAHMENVTDSISLLQVEFREKG